MGVYVVDKPLGRTSFDAVAVARRGLGTRRIGHTGTLDPLATGVLVLTTNESTKLVQFLTGDTKDYLAFVSLGAGTPTLDAEGPVLETAPMPPLNSLPIEEALEGLRGPQLQRPPAYSAIQVNGVRAYAAARAGETVALEPRQVVVHRLDLLAALPSMEAARGLRFAPGGDGWRKAKEGKGFELPQALGNFPTLVLFASVSSGTYLRALARDLGERLGLPAHLAGLVRTRVGRFALETAVPLEALGGAKPLGDLEALDLPRLTLTQNEARSVRDGKRLPSSRAGLVALEHGGRLVAVAEGDGASLKVRRAWA